MVSATPLTACVRLRPSDTARCVQQHLGVEQQSPQTSEDSLSTVSYTSGQHASSGQPRLGHEPRADTVTFVAAAMFYLTLAAKTASAQRTLNPLAGYTA